MVNKLVMNNCTESLKKMYISSPIMLTFKNYKKIFQLASVCPKTGQSGDLARSSSELAVARVRIWLAGLAVPNTGLAVLLRFADRLHNIMHES